MDEKAVCVLATEKPETLQELCITVSCTEIEITDHNNL